MRDLHRHMDGDELELYSAGVSSPEQTAALEEHLLTCEECRNQLQSTDEYVLAMRSASRLWLAPALPPVTVDLIARRGAGAAGSAPADRALLLHPDLTGLAASPSYRLQLVDQNGREVWHSPMESARGSVQLAGLSGGIYFVRVYLPSGELLREYGLEVR